MAIAFDVAPVGTSTSAGGSSLTWSHTCTGTNLLLFVHFASSSGAPHLTATVTYNGTGTGWVELWDITGQSFFHTSGWYAVGVATGAHNVVATLTGGSDDELAGSSMSWTGVDQTTPVGTAVTANGNSATASVTITIGSNEVGLCGAYCGASAITAGQTTRNEHDNVGGNSEGIESTTSTGSVAMTWTFSSTGWVTGAVPIKPVASASFIATANKPILQAVNRAGTF